MARHSKKKVDTYELYRRVLKKPQLTDKEIDEMRKHVILLAQIICEHVWGKKFY
jgi:hypothetical protein